MKKQSNLISEGRRTGSLRTHKRCGNFNDIAVVVLFAFIVLGTVFDYPGFIFADENRPPFPASNPIPPNGTTEVPRFNTTLDWDGGDPDGDPVTYDVYFGANNPPQFYLDNISDSNCTLYPLMRNTTYYWRIRTEDIHGNATDGPEWNFRTAFNTAPYEPVYLHPPYGEYNVPILLQTLVYGAIDPDLDNVTYDVYFGDSSPPPKVANRIEEMVYWLPLLNFNTRYYWSITAWDDHDAFTEGPEWWFQTVGDGENHPPRMPNNPYPGDNSIGISVDTDLYWHGGDPDLFDTVTYAIYFEDDPSPIWIGNITEPSGVDELSYDLPGTLEYQTDYYWRIEACDNHGNCTDGPLWTFETEIYDPPNNPPHVPYNPVPLNGASDVNPLDASISWEGGDPDQGDFVTYDVYFANHTDPSLLADNITYTNYNLGDLNSTTTYFWRIEAWDNHGAWRGGPEWHFTTGEPNFPPEPPSNPTPVDGATGIDIIDTVLHWNCTDPEQDPLTYDVYFGNHTSPPLWAANTTYASYPLDELNYTSTYYWRIVAWDDHNNYAEGPQWHFDTIINNPPDEPSDPEPYDGQTGLPLIGTILRWIGGDQDPGDTVTHDLYFGNHTSLGGDDLLASGIIDVPEGHNEYTDLYELDYNTTYYWFVNSTDTRGSWTAGDEWRFTTIMNLPPYPAHTPDPADGAFDIPIIGTILSWIGGGDPEGDDVFFNLYFGNETSQELLAYNTTNTTYPLDELGFGTTYYWHVDSRDDYGNLQPGFDWYFITEINYPPGAPEVIYPENHATGIPIIDTILNWFCDDPNPEDELYFDVYFGNHTDPLLLIDNITEMSYEVYNLTYNTTYYWSITAWDEHGNWTEGDEWDFETETPNDPPVAYDQAVAVYIDTPKDITLEVTDPDEDPLEFHIVREPYHGDLEQESPGSPNVTYTPDAGFKGKDSFTFKAYDGQEYSNIAKVYIYMWTTPERLDIATLDGTEPTLSYSPDGDLRVFYNVGILWINHMVERIRLSGQTDFSPERFVYDNGRTVDIHYDTSGAHDLAVDNGDFVVILKRNFDTGEWDPIVEDYDSRHPFAYPVPMPLGFTEDGDDVDLRLFYTYKDFTSPGGNHPDIYYAYRGIDNVWINEGMLYDDADNAAVRAIYENGDKISVFSNDRHLYQVWGGIYHSTDNGDTFEFMRGGYEIPEFLEAEDVAVGRGGRLYYVRSYQSNGPWPNHQLIFRYSDDDGATWEENQPIIENSYFRHRGARLAIDGDKIVVVWGDNPEITRSSRYLRCVISEDGGATWSPVQTIVALEGEWDEIEVAFPGMGQERGIDIENHGCKFSVAYSTDIVLDDRAGVYLMELNLCNKPMPHDKIEAGISSPAEAEEINPIPPPGL